MAARKRSAKPKAPIGAVRESIWSVGRELGSPATPATASPLIDSRSVAPTGLDEPWWASTIRLDPDQPPPPIYAPPVPDHPVVHPVAVCRWCGNRFYRVHAIPPQYLCLTQACADRQVRAAIPRVLPSALADQPSSLDSPWLFLPLPLNIDLAESPYKRTLLAGAAGASKSFGARWSAYRFCLMNPGSRVLLIRESYDSLNKNHCQYMPAEALQLQIFAGHGTVKFLGGNYKQINFENGSVFMFGYCATDADVPKLMGPEIDLLVLEEASNQVPKAITEIPTRDRGSPTARALGATDGKTWLLSNPGGVGMLTLVEHYIERRPDPQEFPHYNAAHHGYLRATLDDNPYLAPDYAEKTLSGLSASRYKQLRNGDWSVFVGAFMSDFDPTVHVRALAEFA